MKCVSSTYIGHDKVRCVLATTGESEADSQRARVTAKARIPSRSKNEGTRVPPRLFVRVCRERRMRSARLCSRGCGVVAPGAFVRI